MQNGSRFHPSGLGNASLSGAIAGLSETPISEVAANTVTTSPILTTKVRISSGYSLATLG